MKLIHLAACVAAGLCLCGPPASAHHSAAMFDASKELALSGTVKQFQYPNPHAWLIMTVADGDKVSDWSVGLGAPTLIQRMGIQPSSFPVGETLTVRLHPMKDGRNGGEFVSVQKADGSIIRMRGPAPPPRPPGA